MMAKTRGTDLPISVFTNIALSKLANPQLPDRFRSRQQLESVLSPLFAVLLSCSDALFMLDARPELWANLFNRIIKCDWSLAPSLQKELKEAKRRARNSWETHDAEGEPRHLSRNYQRALSLVAQSGCMICGATRFYKKYWRYSAGRGVRVCTSCRNSYTLSDFRLTHDFKLQHIACMTGKGDILVNVDHENASLYNSYGNYSLRFYWIPDVLASMGLTKSLRDAEMMPLVKQKEMLPIPLAKFNDETTNLIHSFHAHLTNVVLGNVIGRGISDIPSNILDESQKYKLRTFFYDLEALRQMSHTFHQAILSLKTRLSVNFPDDVIAKDMLRSTCERIARTSFSDAVRTWLHKDSQFSDLLKMYENHGDLSGMIGKITNPYFPSKEEYSSVVNSTCYLFENNPPRAFRGIISKRSAEIYAMLVSADNPTSDNTTGGETSRAIESKNRKKRFRQNIDGNGVQAKKTDRGNELEYFDVPKKSRKRIMDFMYTHSVHYVETQRVLPIRRLVRNALDAILRSRKI